MRVDGEDVVGGEQPVLAAVRSCTSSAPMSGCAGPVLDTTGCDQCLQAQRHGAGDGVGRAPGVSGTMIRIGRSESPALQQSMPLRRALHRQSSRKHCRSLPVVPPSSLPRAGVVQK